MPSYRRAVVPGGTFFLTLVTEGREPIFADQRWRGLLGDCLREASHRRPFATEAIVLLPDHLHLLMTLPSGDADFSTRVASIKATFTRAYLDAGGVEQPRSESRMRKRRRGVWQRWFWEHTIRDEDDLHRHLDYIHYNPVKHGLARCPHAWDASSFGRHVGMSNYATDWCCACHGRTPMVPDFAWAEGCEGE